MKTLTLEAAADFLYMNPAVLREKAKAGIIQGAKPGKRWVFLEEDLVSYLRSIYPQNRQASLSGCEEKSSCHYSNAAIPGGSASRPPAENAYAALLGLKTGKKPKSMKIG